MLRASELGLSWKEILLKVLRASELGLSWKEILLKVLRARGSYRMLPCPSLHRLSRDQDWRRWEAGCIREHACTLVCIQVEFINFICINCFNNQGIFNSTSSIQEYTEKYLAFESYLCKCLFELSSQNHRMVWIGRDLKDHLVPTFRPRAGTPSTRPRCSKPHPTWPQTLRGGSHSFSGQPVPAPHHPHSKEFIPYT